VQQDGCFQLVPCVGNWYRADGDCNDAEPSYYVVVHGNGYGFEYKEYTHRCHPGTPHLDRPLLDKSRTQYSLHCSHWMLK
jgi:hypothetical protein